MHLLPPVLKLLKTPTTYLVLGLLMLAARLLSGEFGHTDDYLFLVGFSYAADDLFRGIALMGRPLAAIWQFHGFRLGDGMETLLLLRILSLVWVIPIVAILAACWHRAGDATESAVLKSLILVLTPSLGVYLTWAGTQAALISILVSLYAGMLFLRIDTEGRPLSCAKFSLVGFLILIALCFYQPTSFFFLIPVFIRASTCDLQKHVWIRAFAVLFSVLAIYFLGLKAIHLLFFEDSLAASRAVFSERLPDDYFLKLIEFPVLALFGNWAEFSYRPLTWLVRGITIALVIVYMIRRQSVAFASAWILAFSASLLPMLITGNDFPFRTLSFPFALLAVPFLGGLFVVTGWIHSGLPFRPVLFVLTGLLGGSLFWITERGISQPNREDYQKHLQYLAGVEQPMPDQVVYVLSQGIRISTIRKLREFGSASSWVDWVPPAIFTIASSQLQPEDKTLPASFSWFNERVFFRVYPWQKRESGAPALLLDRRFILVGKKTPPPHVFNPERWQSARRKSEHLPQYGRSEILNDGWLFSEFWGFCHPFPDGSLLHATLGLCILEDERLWKLDPGLGPVYFDRTQPGTGHTREGKHYKLVKKGFKKYVLDPAL